MTCYAAQLGDCAGGFTKEHYISESVLKIAGPVIQITGFPWQQGDVSMEVGTSALTSKILCRTHNEQLSELDSVASTFLTELKSSFQKARDNQLSNSIFHTSGHLLELWLLKVLIGLLTLHEATIPQKWINILFQRQPWAEGSGLHIFGTPGTASWFFQLVRVIAVKRTGEPKRIAGAEFGIGGLAMLLAFGKPQFREPGIEGWYRPGRLLIRRDGKQNEHLFSWDDNGAHGTIDIRVEGVTVDQTNIPRPMVQPIRKKSA